MDIKQIRDLHNEIEIVKKYTYITLHGKSVSTDELISYIKEKLLNEYEAGHFSIFSIVDPIEELQIAAIQKNPDNYFRIMNPTEKATVLYRLIS